jgi:hypothetical protein
LAFLAARFSLIDFWAVFLACFSPLSFACATVCPPFARPGFNYDPPGRTVGIVNSWAVFGLIVGGVAVAGAVLWRRWRRWNPTQATSEEARAADFRASTYRDTGGV